MHHHLQPARPAHPPDRHDDDDDDVLSEPEDDDMEICVDDERPEAEVRPDEEVSPDAAAMTTSMKASSVGGNEESTEAVASK